MRAAGKRLGVSLMDRLTRVPAAAAGDATARKNMIQLIYLRWIAVIGQVVTITLVQGAFHIALPISRMAVVLAALVTLNLASLLRLKRPQAVSNGELFMVLVLDTLALTAQLYFSGGAVNPFTALYLLQVILAAMLLEVWSTWVMVVITVACFFGLTLFYWPIALPLAPEGRASDLYILGRLIGYALDAVLLVILVTRINANLRARDAHLADLRQSAAEEGHIVRMGLLASGAAHELGTPLATLDVILSDWRRMPKLAKDAELAQEIEDMRAEVLRCKTIVTGVLLSAGEARGEAPVITTLKTFLDEVVDDWRSSRWSGALTYSDELGEDLSIVSDSALKQVIHNLLDNAAEASSREVMVKAWRGEDELMLAVSDTGPGFTPEMLAGFGKPYSSSKGKLGGGLGLFLVVNVVRKLGGQVVAENPPEGGARVTLALPLSALRIEHADVR